MRQNPGAVKLLCFHLSVRIAIGLVVIADLEVDTRAAEDFTPGLQKFRQEIARTFKQGEGLPPGRVQLIEVTQQPITRAFLGGQWYEFDKEWQKNESLAPRNEEQFAFADAQGKRVEIPVPWREVRQLLRFGTTNIVSAGSLIGMASGKLISLGW